MSPSRAQSPSGDVETRNPITEKYRGTPADQRDMVVLGKSQVCFRRTFKLVPMLGFASTVVGGWEFMNIFLMFVLIDGGPPALFWGSILAAIGFLPVYASMAEMASMCSTAGGQYHWVSEFAPPRYQRVLSYSVGWLSAMGWQVWLAGISFIVGTIIQGFVALNIPSHDPQPWHGTLLSIAAVSFGAACNTFLAIHMPTISKIAMIVHFFGFLAVVTTLWTTASHGDAREALLHFTNSGGWPSTALSTMIGIMVPMTSLLGLDCIAHMSEETNDASRNMPIAMMWSVPFNIVLNIIMATTLVFCLGDVESVMTTRTGQPFIQLYYNATRSHAGTNVLAAVVITMLTLCCVNEVATSSRQLWSFSRDRGLPGSSWLSQVNARSSLPLRAVFVSLTVTSLLSLINLGSTVALNAINSLGTVSLLTSYITTIGCLVWRRLYGAPLPASRWSLGRYGLAINIVSLIFLLPVIFFVLWPLESPVTAENMNWSSVMFSGVLLIAAVFYLVKARFEYTGPVVQVKRIQ